MTMQTAAAIQNMLRHPSHAPMAPLNVRDNSIPISKPLIIDPITFPLCAVSARFAASGMISCGTMEDNPRIKQATCMIQNAGAMATPIKDSTATEVTTMICLRFSIISPNGTNSNRPVMQQACYCWFHWGI